jgi:hypothetical protein
MNSNPDYVGPGYWTSWHLKALSANDKDKKIELARCIVIDILHFPCMKCRGDAKEYVRTHSLIPAVNDDDPLSLFEWTVDFHNYVNIKLKKVIGILSLQVAKKLWSEEGICYENCGVDALEEPTVDSDDGLSHAS